MNASGEDWLSGVQGWGDPLICQKAETQKEQGKMGDERKGMKGLRK